MNPGLSYLYNILQGVFIVVDIVILCVLVFAIFKGLQFRPIITVSESKPEEKTLTLRNAVLKERWEEILKKAKSGSLETLQLAIIDADNLVDDILRRMGLEGKHVADRLEQLSPDDFASLGRLWRAHRVRNQLVHEPDFKLSAEEGSRTLSDYEAFLKEAEAI